MKKVWNICTWVLVAIVALLAVLLFGLKLFGLQPYTIVSGSMEPNYPVGSIVYVTKVNANDLRKGDVITFRVAGDTIVTHRIEDVVTDDPSSVMFRTKGDNNNTADGALVAPSSIIGKVQFHIPLIGYIAAFLQSKAGRFTSIAIIFVLIALIILPDILFGKDDKSDKSPKGDTAK
ncbi:MAG: signal peptidase I [Clostridia bacterium]|nr:signal peptidase I [Clostridia bacterium]